MRTFRRIAFVGAFVIAGGASSIALAQDEDIADEAPVEEPEQEEVIDSEVPADEDEEPLTVDEPVETEEPGDEDDGGSSIADDARLAADTLADLADDEDPEQVYQVTVPRFSWIKVPTFVLDGFFTTHEDMWTGGFANFEYQAEFVIRKPDEYDLVIGLAYANLNTPDGWWLESGDPLRSTDWGEQTLSLLGLEFAIHWLSEFGEDGEHHLYYGPGIGGAYVLNKFEKYDVDPTCLGGQGDSEDVSLLDNCFDATGNPQTVGPVQLEDRIPPVIPTLSLTLGYRYIIADTVAIGVEGGLKAPYFYAGASLGFIWD